jgi:sodium-independent sulfate anion transporter 11
MKVVDEAIKDVREDYTWNRVGGLTKRGLKAAPTTAAHYIIDKAPIIGWLPRYNPRWIINDVIAGLTIGYVERTVSFGGSAEPSLTIETV